jgi:hypothetical protein
MPNIFQTKLLNTLNTQSQTQAIPIQWNEIGDDKQRQDGHEDMV